MNILFIGGTGLISKAVSHKVLEKGYRLTVFNRGNNNDLLPQGTRVIVGDINNEDQARQLLQNETFDVVVNWIAFGKDQVERDYRLFKGKTKQYIFISSASAYQKPVQDYPITEQTPLENPFWEYSRNKIDCEEYLQNVSDTDFNVTIIRPSHTYDDHQLMLTVKEWGSEYTLIDRIKKGLPYIIPGDGTSLWTITHNSDFALAFVEVLGNEKTYNEAYHITSDFYYTWDQLYCITCKALGKEPNKIYIPTEHILKHMPHKVGEFYGDKHYSVIFDNTKIKQIAPQYQAKVRYEDIVEKAITHYETHKELQVINQDLISTYEKIISTYQEFIK